MSLENEDQRSPDQPADTNHESQKMFKISYTRDFLLSLSELDVCKKLPSGFDQSILGEFEDTSQDRQRIYGGLSSQNFRRNEYGSSPPTRGDSNNYSRGIHGRWESRSRDSDSQSDWDSDSGRRYGNQSRRSWQNPEHDGLLGSGSFARPSGYVAGASAPKLRANDHYQLSKSNEPYHPPRPYKAVPHTRRDTNDLYNDETFGSDESTSQDRAEEERKRRDSFELLRKEQHKAFQEKQNQNPDKHKLDCISGITALLEESKDEKRLLNRNDESDESVIIPASHNDSGKSLLPSQTPASRPLVPPGFTSTILERNFGTKSLINSHPAEAGNPELEDSLLHAKANPLLNGTSDNQEEKQSAQQMGLSEQQLESMGIHVPIVNKIESTVNLSSASEGSNKKIGMDKQPYETSNFSEAGDALTNGEIVELDAEKVIRQNIGTLSNQDHSTSILEKLFCSASSVNTNGSSSFIEHHDSKVDDTWSPSTVQSSKFAHWFLEDEKKPVDELSSGRPNDLLSLIVGGEKGGSQFSDVKATEQIPPDIPFQSFGFTNRHATSSLTSASVEITEQLFSGNKTEAVPAVLTCEDLEQSILSEISENSSTLQPPVQGWNVLEAKTDQPKTDIDNRASQHLLSLLQKGTDLKDMAPSPTLDIGSSDKIHVFEVSSIGTALNNSREAQSEKVNELGKTLTLETLFGTAFMKELQSFEAPVSSQRGSVGSARLDIPESHGLLFPVIDNVLPPSTVGETVSSRTGHESSVLASKHRPQTELDKIEGHWLGFNDPRTEVDSSKLQTEVGYKLGGFDGAVDIRLPEEDSLITVGDPVNTPHSVFIPAGDSTKAELLSSSNTPVGIAEKLAALNAVFKDERSMVRGPEGAPFLRGSFDMIESEIPYQNRHAQPSPPQFHHPHQMNHGRPLFHSLDAHPAHINAQMKYPENIIRHDTPLNHQFNANMLRPPFHHPNTGFDPPTHHPMLQQLHMPGNLPPPHLLQGLPPRGSPLPPHPNNQPTGFIQEPDPMQGFPIGHRQANFGGPPGMPLPAPDIGVGNHPDALQRLIEMELRSNAKQIHPLAGHGQGMYGHELDMSFRYR
ncbi:hypothetical protein L1049_013290 [Liquidambar formosana]|uniref:Uncharacterized protein n=1 Tax=Liquidambar formosana TaxID=63359 RepID=A0AAP0WWS3_LIQFO